MTIHGKGGGSTPVVEQDTLKLNAVAKGVYIFSEGPVEGLATGDGKSIYLNDVPILDSNGKTSFKGVAWSWRNGLPDQTYIDGFSNAVTYQSVDLEVFTGISRTITIANGAENYDAALIVIQIPILSIQTKAGNYRKTAIAYNIDVKASGGSFVRAHTVSFNQKSDNLWEGTYRVDLPQGATSWEIRVTRVTEDSMTVADDDGTFRQNRTILARYATVTNGKFTYRNTAVMGVQYDAVNFGNSIPSLKAMIKGIKVWVPKNYDPVTRLYATSGSGTSGGIWDGSFKVAWTNNPAWIYYDLLVNNRYGLGEAFNPDDDVEDAFVDKWTLYNIAKYCDGLVDDGLGSFQPRYTINMQITVTDAREAYDLLQSLLTTIHAMIYFSNDQVVAIQDAPTTISDSFSQADVVSGSFEYQGTSLKDRHSVFIVSFRDEASLYKPSTVMYEEPDAMNRFGYRLKQVALVGCTNRAQALRAAKWEAFTEQYQTQTVSFTTGQRGGLITPGEVIKIFDSYKSGRRAGGRVLGSGYGTRPHIHVGTVTNVPSGPKTWLLMDGPVSVNTGCEVIYYNSNGDMISYSVASSTTDSPVLYIAGEHDLPQVGQPFAVVFPDLDGRQLRVLSVKENAGESTYDIIGLTHLPGKFSYMDTGILVDENPTSVLTSDAISPITSATAKTYYEEVSGARSLARVSVSWSAPKFTGSYSIPSLVGQLDYRITGYQFDLLTPGSDYTRVYDGTEREWSSSTIEVSVDANYGGRVRAYDALGRFSTWFELEAFTVLENTDHPDPPTNISMVPVINGIAVNWDNATDTDFAYTEVRISTTNNYASAPVISNVSDDFYIISDIRDDNPRYVFLTTVSHATTNNRSLTYISASAIRTKVTSDDIDDSIATINQLNLTSDQLNLLILREEAYRAVTTGLLYTGDGTTVKLVALSGLEQSTNALQRFDLLAAVLPGGSSAVLNVDTVMISPTESLAQHLDYVTSTLGDGTITVSELKEAVDGQSGRIALAVNGNGQVTGLDFGISGTTSHFDIVSSNFRIIDPTAPGTFKTPFQYSSGIITLSSDVVIDGNLVINGTVSTGKLGTNSVTNYGATSIGAFTNVGSETTVSTTIFNPDSGRVRLTYSLTFTNSGSTRYAIRIKVFKDGTNISGSQMYIGDENFTTTCVNFVFDESGTSVNGTYTISVQTVTGTSIGDTGGTPYAANVQGGRVAIETFKR